MSYDDDDDNDYMFYIQVERGHPRVSYSSTGDAHTLQSWVVIMSKQIEMTDGS